MPPLVSVIIPCFNSGQFLADAVKSVFRQTYSALECIVIDDGSTDHTEDILRELLAMYPSLKAMRKTNGGLSSARNMGLRLCSGSLISFLDADDVLLPDKIERQVAFLDSHPDVGLVYSDYLVVSEKLDARALFTAEMPRDLDPLDAFCYRNWFNSLVTLLRRTLIDEVGGFDEELAVAEDWDYWIRCAKVARLSYLEGPVGLYRQHGGQIHRDHGRMRHASIQVAIKNFRGNRKRFRLAMTATELAHAKYLWSQHKRMASVVALMKYAVRGKYGLDMGSILRQLQNIRQSQLKRCEPRPS
jgi:glycosyltransferase involved in cell wall biosynthesis